MSVVLAVFLASAALSLVLGHPSHIDPSLPLPSISLEAGQRKRASRPSSLRGLQTNTTSSSRLAPLYPGYGTHYAYIYVGTPPKRQSVIIDTGSHYTAFPCVGCLNCGAHTDPYYNPALSTSAVVEKCGTGQCLIGQSYSEGSSWKAYKLTDKLWVGGLTPNMVPGAQQMSIDYPLACQTSETGLFKTQLADGIMGLSNSEDTLMPLLKKAGIVDNKIFALCFRIGGGVISLAGVDQRIHLPSSVYGLQYAKLARTGNWYTLNLLDLFLEDQVTGTQRSIAKPPVGAAIFNMGKGVIIDSGTTATYLPSFLLSEFKTAFKAITDFDYTADAPAQLSAAQLKRIPNLVWHFEGTDGRPVIVRMPYSNVVDSDGGGTYTYKVLLTEGSGTVLGANFMTGYNMIFDVDGRRVGFAESECRYESVARPLLPPMFAFPTLSPTLAGAPTVPDVSGGSCIGQPLSMCSAECNQETGSYQAKGKQSYKGSCEHDCTLSCDGYKIVRGPATCPDGAWGECSDDCKQTRKTGRVDSSGNCLQDTETRSCYTASCPTKQGDYLVFIDMKVKRIEAGQWSYAYAETFIAALSKLFDIPDSSVEILSAAGGEISSLVKLHFELRLSLNDFKDIDNNGISDLYDAAQSIPTIVNSDYFPQMFISQLQAASISMDKIDYNRYGWLTAGDIEVINSLAIPLGEERDPIDIPEDESPLSLTDSLFSTTEEMFLLGVALTAILLLLVILCLYNRLQAEHAALSKDKLSGFSLRELWARLSDDSKRFRGRDSKHYNRLRQTEMELSSAPMMDNQLDGGDLDDMHS